MKFIKSFLKLINLINQFLEVQKLQLINKKKYKITVKRFIKIVLKFNIYLIYSLFKQIWINIKINILTIVKKIIRYLKKYVRFIKLKIKLNYIYIYFKNNKMSRFLRFEPEDIIRYYLRIIFFFLENNIFLLFLKLNKLKDNLIEKIKNKKLNRLIKILLEFIVSRISFIGFYFYSLYKIFINNSFLVDNPFDAPLTADRKEFNRKRWTRFFPIPFFETVDFIIRPFGRYINTLERSILNFRIIHRLIYYLFFGEIISKFFFQIKKNLRKLIKIISLINLKYIYIYLYIVISICIVPFDRFLYVIRSIIYHLNFLFNLIFYFLFNLIFMPINLIYFIYFNNLNLKILKQIYLEQKDIFFLFKTLYKLLFDYKIINFLKISSKYVNFLILIFKYLFIGICIILFIYLFIYHSIFYLYLNIYLVVIFFYYYFTFLNSINIFKLIKNYKLVSYNKFLLNQLYINDINFLLFQLRKGLISNFSYEILKKIIQNYYYYYLNNYSLITFKHTNYMYTEKDIYLFLKNFSNLEIENSYKLKFNITELNSFFLHHLNILILLFYYKHIDFKLFVKIYKQFYYYYYNQCLVLNCKIYYINLDLFYDFSKITADDFFYKNHNYLSLIFRLNLYQQLNFNCLLNNKIK
jgi:hypothetical protein